MFFTKPITPPIIKEEFDAAIYKGIPGLRLCRDSR